jgi:hypothetical protein
MKVIIHIPVSLMSSSVLSSRDAACEELVKTVSAPSLIQVSAVQDLSMLRELWEIDKEAYQDHSIEFESFERWWTQYPNAGRCLLIGGRIVGSLGIYPLSEKQAAQFIAGEIREEDLFPFSEWDCLEYGAKHWYFSGIVIVEKWRNAGLARPLMRCAIGAWRNSGHIAYPCYMYGQAQTEMGRKALELFGLKVVTPGSKLPDGLDLYGAKDCSPQALQKRFRSLS